MTFLPGAGCARHDPSDPKPENGGTVSTDGAPTNDTTTAVTTTAGQGSGGSGTGGQGTAGTTGGLGTGGTTGGSGADQGTGGASTLGGSMTTGGSSSFGGSAGGGGAVGLGVSAEGWGTVRCFKDEELEEYECFAELPGGTVAAVYPSCSIQSIGQSPGIETLGTDPYEVICGDAQSTPEDLQRWDQIQCWKAEDTLCMAGNGDWAIWVSPDCDPEDGDFIPADDPDFLECSYDTDVWEDVRCRYLDTHEEDIWCEGRRGSYWSSVKCRITWSPESEVEPNSVPCLTFD